ncbi:Pre-mRNA-splicing factor Cwf15/Cwc15 [Melampsora americana]|nr:Pre-mRNA-splicing factor Cwf15/Cwc15 [Melampsora americana]
MSSAHRPTWTPAMGKDARLNTKQYSSRDIAGHTKLKYRQPGQNSIDDISRRDLKLELILAEKEANAKKRRAAGLLPLIEESSSSSSTETKSIPKTITHHEEEEDELKAKRRKILEEALLADKDDSDSEDEDEDHGKKSNKSGKPMEKNGNDHSFQGENGDDDDEMSDDSDDDENETAELLKELEKIKRERAEEKERLEQERAATDAVDKETLAAMGNPLLNLKAALNVNGNTSPTNSVSTSTTSFSVKKRWDDDVIFKNQARDVNEKPKKEFVNDLLRTEFHRRFLKKFIA